jgi:Flp pilus assembly protein TadG
VALVELALSLIFLVPLLVGMLDFGYYFYVGSNAEEAARAGVREAVRQQGTVSCTVVATTVATTNAVQMQATNSTSACNATGGDAACYMNQPPLRLGGLSNTTVTATCNPGGPVDPTWTVQVQVDFTLAHGFFRTMFRPSTNPACGLGKCVRYIATATGTP